MLKMSLGNIEVYGLAAALEAADAATKSANVKLIGYEATDGLGMVAVKIEGDVSAVQSAISAAKAAAGRISRVFASSVIARPSEQLECVVDTDATVGRGASPSARPLESKPHPRDHKPEDAPVAESEAPAVVVIAESAKPAEPAEPATSTESAKPEEPAAEPQPAPQAAKSGAATSSAAGNTAGTRPARANQRKSNTTSK